MMAAKTSSAESVELLLRHQADPNLLSEKNDKQDGDLQSQARIRLSKDELRTDILSGDVQMTDDR